jgi:hypothetical protein
MTVRFIAAAALALCAEPVLNTPAQFADWMKSASAKWAKVVKQANLKIQ